MLKDREIPHIGLLLLLLLKLLMINDAIASTSAIVKDHDVYSRSDETEESLTPEEKLEIEQEILKLLGISEKPRNVKKGSREMKRSARKFITNLYEDMTVDNVIREKRNKLKNVIEFNLSAEELMAIDRSDDIIMFPAQQNHQGAGGKPDRVKRMWFDVKTVPKDESMVTAELRLYRGPEMSDEKYRRRAFTVNVYRVLGKTNGVKKMQLVDSANTTAEYKGWLTFDVSESLQYWMKYPSDNRGLFLSAHSIDGSNLQPKLENIGIVGFGNTDDGEGEDREPFMVGYFQNSGLSDTEIGFATANSDNFEMTINRRSHALNKRNWSSDLFHRKTLLVDTPLRSCQVQRWEVNFEDLPGWKDWILAPKGFSPGYCDGLCKHPISVAPEKGTNHAFVQAAVHLLHPEKVPSPCCVPTKLGAISILYFLDDKNVIFKKVNDMVVESCGCH